MIGRDVTTYKFLTATILLYSGWPPDRQDFSTNVIPIRFPADELFVSAMNIINTVSVSIGAVIDDEINEAEEFLIVVLSAENATDPSKIRLSRGSSVVKIIDNDGMLQSVYTMSSLMLLYACIIVVDNVVSKELACRYIAWFL